MASEAVQLVADLGGELVTYIQWGGVPKSFKALVERQPEQVESFGGASYPVGSLVVTFPRDSPNGVMTVSKGKDKIRLKKNTWDSDETEFTVVQIDEQPAWMTGGIGDLWKVVVK